MEGGVGVGAGASPNPGGNSDSGTSCPIAGTAIAISAATATPIRNRSVGEIFKRDRLFDLHRLLLGRPPRQQEHAADQGDKDDEKD